MALENRPQPVGSLAYLKYNRIFESEKSYFIRFPIDDIPEAKQINLEFEYCDVDIHDIRGRYPNFKFNETVFEFAEFRTKLTYEDFGNFEKSSNMYYQEIEEFLKKQCGFTWVEVYDSAIRRRTPEFPATQFQEKYVQPIRAVHIDSSRTERQKQALKSLSRAGFDPKMGRTVMLGVWRPLKGPIRDWPLAVCDYRSCKPKDIVYVDQVYPDSVGEGCNVFFNKRHEWYFASDMMPHEVWIIKQMDSDPNASDRL
ncbi:hypothetical protein N7454_001677 [Penicillium verhagenii]|nr:hypothetical protein N7454_001677 [Penicillium verhagenii]